MSISPIRRFTDEDATAVESAAVRFAKRHGLKIYDDQTAVDQIDYYLLDDRRLARLWTGCYCRALGVPRSERVTTGWGYVGMRDES